MPASIGHGEAKRINPGRLMRSGEALPKRSLCAALELYFLRDERPSVR
jgi:hypothetical protein